MDPYLIPGNIYHCFMLVLPGYSRDSLFGKYFTGQIGDFYRNGIGAEHVVSNSKQILRPRMQTSMSFANTDSKVDTKRRKSFNAFMLTPSDQQLVVGSAMIIAALVQHCGISCYEFQVVMSLALLASTTHLATLVVIQQYLRENKVVRNI